MSWATIQETVGYTGETVDQADLDIASFLITLYAGVFEDQPENSILANDRRWIKMATAYQAIWMRPKRLTLLQYRESHKDTSADGVRTSRTTDADIMLAPLAARALRNLSWIGDRSTLSIQESRSPKGIVNPFREFEDEWNTWKGLPIS